MNTTVKPERQIAGPGYFVEWQMREFSPLKSSHGLKVLLVAADATTRARVGEWIAGEGHEVIECPGPGAPDYTCVGGRGGDCPLAKVADIVVIDLDLASDAMLAGTPSWQLVDYYLAHGHPVVAISGPAQMGRFYLDDRVVSLDRPADRDAVLEAVEDLSEKRSSVAEIGTFRLTPRRRVHRPYVRDGRRTENQERKPA